MKTAYQTIGIDARFYGPVGKGLGRYTQEIVDRIIKLDQTNHYVIFLSKHNFKNFHCDGRRVRKVLADIQWYSLQEQLMMPWLIKRAGVELMHFPHFNVPLFCPVKFVVTIHDLILTKYPTVRASRLSPLVYRLKNLAYKLVIWQAIKRSSRIITVSEFTKQDIINNFKIASSKVVVTYEGVAVLTEHQQTRLDSDGAWQDLASRKAISKPYLLYVGNAYPHKNLEGLITIFKKLIKRHKLQLVLVGKMDYFYQRLQDLVTTNGFNQGPEPEIIFAGFVPDNDLDLLYRHAMLYVFPSFYEGFGLPPLEAMARSCPVASSDQGSLPEILGEAVYYFNPHQKSQMLSQLETIISNQSLRADLVIKGLTRIKLFDWQTCARETLVVYQQI